jgi:DNA-binding CsgD family transcriptional regulator
VKKIKDIEITDHHIRMVQLLSEGYKAFEIGQKLHLSARTIEAHVQFLLKKLNCRNTAHLVGSFLRYGLLDLDFSLNYRQAVRLLADYRTELMSVYIGSLKYNIPPPDEWLELNYPTV